nr:hypothetical protein [Tanacetum cinerariifolium]
MNDQEMFDADKDLQGKEVVVEQEVFANKEPIIDVVQITQEESSKRARDELEQESSKKQKIDDDTDTTELKQLANIISDEEGVAINAIPLAVKPSSIVDWKIIKESLKKSYYQMMEVQRTT